MRRRKKHLSSKIYQLWNLFSMCLLIYIYIFFSDYIAHCVGIVGLTFFPKSNRTPKSASGFKKVKLIFVVQGVLSQVWIVRAMLNSHIPVIPMGNHICCLWVGISSIFSLGKVDWGYIFSFYQVKGEKKSWLFLIQWRSHLHYKTIIII